MRKKVVVLGAGMVGSVIAADLAPAFEVTSADINEEALNVLHEKGINTQKADLSRSEEVRALVRDFDLVVGAVPGYMGYETVRNVILEGKDMVDISFFPEDPFTLDALAREHGSCTIVDCGVAPGMGNIILGYLDAKMDVETYQCMVGGLPVERTWPFEYKAVFSPIDVIEEYVRPARYIVNGKLVVKEALSDPETIEVKGIGTLEAWNSDGLRSLIKTMGHIPDMIEKTLRYPGTIEYLRVLRAIGYFSTEPVEINGQKIRPVDLSAKLLFPLWKLKPGEEEFTVMQVDVSGKENGKRVTWTYFLYDKFDATTGFTSMARTTGFTCTAAVHLLLNKGYREVGICPPEYLGKKTENFEFIIDYLQQRNVLYKISREEN